MNVRHTRVSYIHFLSKILFKTFSFSCDDRWISDASTAIIISALDCKDTAYIKRF